jgi:hypothetical protein
MRLHLVILLIAWRPLTTGAQLGETPHAAARHSTEWAFTTGAAFDLPGGVQGGEFWTIQLRWGKVLTPPIGPGFLRGTLEYAFEVVPAIILRETRLAVNVAPLARGTVFGGGINPFYWQYNFISHPRLIPYINFGGGLLFTTKDFPAETSSFNFTPQGGAGVYWVTRPGRALNVGVRYHHASNAGHADANPGHNALYFYAGYSWWR